MNEIVINVEGKSYVVNRQLLMAWLNQNGKVFTGQSTNINEINQVDGQGRSVLNG